ncbi:sigma-70 family RNA polymerase sigma factor [candidate division FCPU426 bacterium]|nr:sigma-70 family RNA polymerase sigma factor [candidate division FCPU426 bacterium]
MNKNCGQKNKRMSTVPSETEKKRGGAEREDWRLYKEKHDTKALNRLYHRYLPAVQRMVARMRIYLPDGACGQEDLFQAAVIGMCQAMDSFCPGQGTPFLNFAYQRIRGAVYDELRALDGYSVRARRQRKLLEKIKEQLQQKILHVPSEEETAREMGINLEQFRMLQNGLQTVKPESLEWIEEIQPGTSGRDKRENWIPESGGLSRMDRFQMVARRIDHLPERAKRILGLYYRDGLTLKEISRILYLTESRICQIHAATLKVLSRQLRQLEEVFAKKRDLKGAVGRRQKLTTSASRIWSGRMHA